MNVAALRTKSGLSAIFDDRSGNGVVLDDWTGTYWKLDRAALSLLCRLAREACVTRTPGVEQAGVVEDAVLRDLLAIGLVEEAPGRITPAPRPPVLEPITPKSMSVLPVGMRDMPKLRSLAAYFALNVRFRFETAVTGWRAVRLRKDAGGPDRAGSDAHLLAVVEEVLACMRLAALLPLTSKSCVPRALTAYEMCRRRGLTPKLVVGAYVEPFEPHIWVECADQMIDTGRADFSLDRFTPLHLCHQERP